MSEQKKHVRKRRLSFAEQVVWFDVVFNLLGIAGCIYYLYVKVAKNVQAYVTMESDVLPLLVIGIAQLATFLVLDILFIIFRFVMKKRPVITGKWVVISVLIKAFIVLLCICALFIF